MLTPLGFLLDLLFGNAFFVFPNKSATLGWGIPAFAGAIPSEEFVFYLAGFMLVLLSYNWCDEHWMAAYNVRNYAATAEKHTAYRSFSLYISGAQSCVDRSCDSVSFTTVITYEVIRFGRRSAPPPSKHLSEFGNKALQKFVSRR